MINHEIKVWNEIEKRTIKWSPRSGRKSWVFLLLWVFSERKKMAKMKANDVLNSRHYLWICFGIAFHLIAGGFGSKGTSFNQNSLISNWFFIETPIVVSSNWIENGLVFKLHYMGKSRPNKQNHKFLNYTCKHNYSPRSSYDIKKT